MKRKHQVIIALAVAVLLGASYLALKILTPKEETTSPDLYIIERNEEELRSVAFSVWGENPFVLEASGQAPNRTYSMADYPAGFEFRDMSIETVFGLAANLEALRIIEENPKDLSTYGLKDPVSVVKTTYGDGASDEIRIGNKTSFNDGYYVTVNDDNTVYMIDLHSGNLLTRNLYFFRDPALVPAWDAPLEEIHSFSLKQKGKDEIEVRRQTDEEKAALGKESESDFLVTKPTRGTANEEYLLASLFTPAARFYSDAVVYQDSPPILEPYGLSEGTARITVTSDEGEFNILVGDRTPDGKSYFVMREGTETVSVVSVSIIDKILTADPAELTAS